MKYALSLLGCVAVASLLSSTVAQGQEQRSAPPAATHRAPESTAVLVHARTVAVIGLTGPRLMDRLWANPDGRRAQQKVEGVLRDWRKYEVVYDPAQSDLVLLIIESQKNLSPFKLANLVAELRVYRRGQTITPSTPTLWSGEAAESFRKLPSTRVAEKFRDHVAGLPDPGTEL
jgi:hypothetical protein